MRKGHSRPLTPEQTAELQAPATLPDERIDISEMPEVVDWSGARRGALHRPIKRQIALRIERA